MKAFSMDGWFADFDRHEFYFGRLTVDNGKVSALEEVGSERVGWNERGRLDRIILPGLIDSHVHIESSLIMPSRFARQAVQAGTVATVSDPHEIANVLGLEGINLMLEDAEKACIKIYFAAPSCVPATSLETSGAVLDAKSLEPLFRDNRVVALGEMMNYPGVLYGDEGVREKIALSKKYGKPVDGHAPGMVGADLDTYAGAGITTDHECITLEEAREKVRVGMKVLVRGGTMDSCFDPVCTIIDEHPGFAMLCTDDFHPDDLLTGHIDRLIRRGLGNGLDFFNLYRAAAINPVLHYPIRVGILRVGDPADFLVADSLEPFHVIETWIDGEPVFRDGQVQAELPALRPLNRFHAQPLQPADIEVKGETGVYRVIRAYDGDLVTGSETAEMFDNKGIIESDPGRDILKIVVLNRYAGEKPAVGWITGFGLKQGALASTIAHDSHNIIAVGINDSEITHAINTLIAGKGGIVATDRGSVELLPLPVAGLMGTGEAAETAAAYAALTRRARSMGSPMRAPYMALAFMALLVIPHLKIGDRGVFDCDTFRFIPLKVS